MLGRHGRGLVEFIPNLQAPGATRRLIEMVEMCGRHGVVSTINVLGGDRSRDRSTPARSWRSRRELRAGGSAFWPQMSPRTIDFRINWETSMVFMMFPEWHRIPNAADDAERARLLRDPEWRAAARAQWDVTPSSMFPSQHPQRVRFIEVTQAGAGARGWAGRWPTSSRRAAVIRRTCSPTGCSRTTCGRACSSSASPTATSTTSPRCSSIPTRSIASSDAGAHVQMMCAAGDTTLLLARHVRDRGDLTVEQAVHELTGKLAERVRLPRPGRRCRGKAADLTVFALDELHWDDDVFVDDLPGGARRLRRPPGGYRYTLANGEVTQEGGVLTDARPAGVLHSATG